MIKEEVQRTYLHRITTIEENFSGSDVPPGILQYFILSRLVFERSFERYYQEFGLYSLEPEVCRQGKKEMGWGDLSNFELDVIALVNRDIERRENQDFRIPTLKAIGSA